MVPACATPRTEQPTPVRVAPQAVTLVGTKTAALLVVGSMIGTGVFTTTGLLVKDLGSPRAVLAAWIVGGLLALCGALSYAELVAALPRNGGEYQLLGRVYHPAIGFAAGVISVVVGFSAPLAASALAFGHYVSSIVPGLSPVAAALGIVVLLAALHATSVPAGGRFQAVVTSVEVALIVLFVAAGLLLGSPSRVLVTGPVPVLSTLASPSFALSLIFVSFAYSGWNGAAYLAGEVRHPSRAIPIALLAGTALVTALYVALNAVFLSSAPLSDLSGVVEVGHVAAAKLLGDGAGLLVSVVIALVLASSVSAMLMAGPRVCEAMGVDHPRLAFLAYRTRKGGPAAAVALQAALAVAMVLTSSFGALLSYVGFTLSLIAGLTVLGVIVLRSREPRLGRPYKTWGYPATPLLFVALSTWMAWHALLENPASSWVGLATIAFALASYAVLGRGHRLVTGRPSP
jgi:basic amino acid/polyamine antiporter, APA family